MLQKIQYVAGMILCLAFMFVILAGCVAQLVVRGRPNRS